MRDPLVSNSGKSSLRRPVRQTLSLALLLGGSVMAGAIAGIGCAILIVFSNPYASEVPGTTAIYLVLNSLILGIAGAFLGELAAILTYGAQQLQLITRITGLLRVTLMGGSSAFIAAGTFVLAAAIFPGVQPFWWVGLALAAGGFLLVSALAMARSKGYEERRASK
jgi:hypothetical protein